MKIEQKSDNKYMRQNEIGEEKAQIEKIHDIDCKCMEIERDKKKLWTSEDVRIVKDLNSKNNKIRYQRFHVCYSFLFLISYFVLYPVSGFWFYGNIFLLSISSSPFEHTYKCN